MKNIFKKNTILNIALFVSGAGVMIFEIIGSRILGPYLGTSFVVWTSIIGVILGSLSLGYHLGGKIADIKSNMKLLSSFFLVISIFLVFNYFLKDNFVGTLQKNILNIKISSIISSVVLFGPISIFFGMISPFIAKIKIKSLEKSGEELGNIYAISTLGSIFGTFFAGFFLIPFFGINNIILILSLIFLFLSVLISKKNYLKTKIFLFFFLVFMFFFESRVYGDFLEKRGIYKYDTSYNSVTVYDNAKHNGKYARVFSIGNEFSSGIYKDNPDLLVAEYMKYYDLSFYFNPNIQNALMIGGAGYVYPTYFLKKYDTKKIDVVEIDSGFEKIAKKHFGLKDDERLKLIFEDGRTFLNKNKKKYDVIFLDAFKSQYSLPFNLTTKEAYEKMYNSLTQDGIIVLNIISSINGEKGKFFRSEYKTIKQVFDDVLVFKAQNQDSLTTQNIVLIAGKKQFSRNLNSKNKYFDSLLKRIYNGKFEEDIEILTDDYAPVDFFMLDNI